MTRRFSSRSGDRPRRARNPRRRRQATKRRCRWRERPSPPMRTAKARAAFPISWTIWPPCGRDGSSATPSRSSLRQLPPRSIATPEAASRKRASTAPSIRSAPRARDLWPRALRAERKLHHRRTRLLPAPPGGGRPRRLRRDQRAGADDGRRREDARLLHQPDRLRRAARRRAAAPDRPGVQRDRLCPAQALCGARRGAAAGWAVDADGAADHRSAGRAARRASRFRRRARRQYRAHGRGHGRGACRRELGARRALVHSRGIARPAPASWSSRSRRRCSRPTFRSA